MRRLLVPLVLAACVEGEAGDSWAGTVDTLANGAVRVSNPVQGSWRAGAGWQLVPELTLGSVNEGLQAFDLVADIEVAADGRIFVLDRRANALHIFDATGTHLRTSGRSGQGPGEFVRANGLAWLPDGDSLLVVDAQGGRYNIFNGEGTYARTVKRPLTGFPIAFEGCISDGRVYERGSRRRNGAAEPVLIGTRLGTRSFLDMGGRAGHDRIPDHKPYFTELHVDPDGNLWVDVPTADGITAFDVFDADGRLMGRLSTGVRRVRWVKPLIRHGRLYMVAAGELDVPNVHVFRIETDTGV